MPSDRGDKPHWIRAELRSARKATPLSQEALAGLTQTSTNSIANFELGTSAASFFTVEKWFKELGYEIDLHKIEKGEGAD